MTITTDRPRIWLRPAILDRLKRNTASPRWKTLLSVCENGWTSDSQYAVHSLNYALVYQVTGDARYADKAVSYAQKFVDQGNAALTVFAPGQREGYICRSMCPMVATTFDWCYNRLTDVQKVQWQQVMVGWHDRIWGDPGRISFNNPGDNFYHGYLMTGFAGYAIGGVAGEAIAAEIRTRWNNQVKPYLEKFGGTMSLEGTDYGTWVPHWYLMAAHLTATGEDDFTDPTFQFPWQSVYGRIHQTSPDTKYQAPLGEQKRIQTAPTSDNHQTIMLMAMSYGDPRTAGWARWWLDRLQGLPTQVNWRWTAWEDALWYNPEVVAIPPAETSLFDQKSGFWSTRSSWAPDATWTVGTCGPTKENHQDKGAGQFYIWSGGEWLTAPARIYGGSGMLMPTKFLNSLLFGDKDQPMPNGDSPEQVAAKLTPKILNSIDVPEYTYVMTEGQGAYAAYTWATQVTNPCESWTREVLWMKPDVWLIRDNAKPPTARWLLQSHGQPVVSGVDMFTLTGGTKPLYGHAIDGAVTAVAIPESGTWRIEGSGSRWLLSLSPIEDVTIDAADDLLEKITNPAPPPPPPVGEIEGSLWGTLVIDGEPRQVKVTVTG